ncbi:MAG: AAA family ATPase [Thermoleophilaceae bacterium]
MRPRLALTDDPEVNREIVAGHNERLRARAMESQTLRQLDVARMVREAPPPIPWAVEGLAARGGLTVLSGAPGAGKSLLASALAAGVATGSTEGGFRCLSGTVVIVDAENGEGEIHRRVRALGMPSKGLRIVEADGFDLTRREDQDALEGLLLDRPDLLVLDSYRSLWSGEENDSGATTKVLQPLRSMLRRHHVAAIMPVHVGRENREYRGSEALAGDVEFGFKLSRAEGDPDPTRRSVECWKARPCAEPTTRWLHFGFESGVFVIDQAEPFETRTPGRPPTAQDQLVPRVLAALATGPLTRSDVARGVGRKPDDGSVRRALDTLETSGQIRRALDGRWALAEMAESPWPARPGLATWPPPKGGGADGQVAKADPGRNGGQAEAAP